MVHLAIRNINFNQNSEANDRSNLESSRYIDADTQEIFPDDCSKIQGVAQGAFSLPSVEKSMGAILPSVSVSMFPPVPDEEAGAKTYKELVGECFKPGTFFSLAKRVLHSLQDQLEKYKEEHGTENKIFSNFENVRIAWHKAANRVIANSASYCVAFTLCEKCLTVLSEKDEKEGSMCSFQFFEIFYDNNFMGLSNRENSFCTYEIATQVDDYCRSLGLSVTNNLHDITCNAAHSFRRHFIRSYFSFSEHGDNSESTEVKFSAKAEAFYSRKLGIAWPPSVMRPNYVIDELENMEIDVNSPSHIFWKQWYTPENLITVVANALEGKTGSEGDQKKIDLCEADRMWWKDLYQKIVVREKKPYFFRNKDEICLKKHYIALAKDDKQDVKAWEKALLAVRNATSKNAWKSPLAFFSSFQEKFHNHHQAINEMLAFALLRHPTDTSLKEIRDTIFSAENSDDERFQNLSDLCTFLDENTTLAKIVEELKTTLSDEQRDKDRREVSEKLNTFDWDSWVCDNTFETFQEVTWNTKTNKPTRYGALILLFENGLLDISGENLSHNSPYEAFLKEYKNYKIEQISAMKDADEIVSFLDNNTAFLNIVPDSVLLQDGVLSKCINSAANAKMWHLKPERIPVLDRILAIKGPLPQWFVTEIVDLFCYFNKLEFLRKIQDKHLLQNGVIDDLLALERDPEDIWDRILEIKGTLPVDLFKRWIGGFSSQVDLRSLSKVSDSTLVQDGVLDLLLENTQPSEVCFQRKGCPTKYVGGGDPLMAPAAKRILKIKDGVPDRIFEKIIEKFGPHLDFDSLKKIPDRFFLKEGVLDKLIKDAKPKWISIPNRILEIEGEDGVPDAIFEKIIEKFGPYLDFDSLKKIPDRFFLKEGVLLKLINTADKKSTSIPNRILEIEGKDRVPEAIFDEITKKFGPDFAVPIEQIKKRKLA